MSILIKNGRVIDPANQRDEILDILIEQGKISQVSKNIKCPTDTVIDAADKVVIPGLVDLHVHLREPGREDKETVFTASAAAAKGGVTSVLAMPNTFPAMDSPQSIRLLQDSIKKTARVNVFICGAITKGRKGKELTDIAQLKEEGVAAISDDGASVESEEMLLEALRKAKEKKLLVSCHCEDKTLSNNGVVNLGLTSTRLGLRGISKESEYRRIERDICLAERASSPIHIAHVSAKESVEAIVKARKRGVQVTAEAAPHHFALSEDAVLDYDTNKKMNPPLRSREDVAAIRQALASGAIDAIASDHAPHTENEKDIEFERAEFGVIGLETELSVAITELIEGGFLSWPELVKRVSLNPAKILGIERGTLSVGAKADIAIIDLQREWAVEKKSFISKSKNSAFLGKKLKGVVEYTICKGALVYPFT